ncbi:hypothetical protein [Lysobacter gummosus]|uniref:hypothetical protein n=1 Tax=Lysobacter gummosus TaxID=262324 RepID=UPI00363F6E1D
MSARLSKVRRPSEVPPGAAHKAAILGAHDPQVWNPATCVSTPPRADRPAPAACRALIEVKRQPRKTWRRNRLAGWCSSSVVLRYLAAIVGTRSDAWLGNV